MGFLPFYHIYGINSLILSVCGYRAQLLVVVSKYTLENFLKAVEKYKITYANIVPPVGKPNISRSLKCSGHGFWKLTLVFTLQRFILEKIR